MMTMRTCPGTCHMTHSWSERRSCGNILSGTWGKQRHSSVLSPLDAQHHEAPEKKKTQSSPRYPAPHSDRAHPQGKLGYGNLCPSLLGQWQHYRDVAPLGSKHCSEKGAGSQQVKSL